MSVDSPGFTVQFQPSLEDLVKAANLSARVHPVLVASARRRTFATCILLVLFSGAFFLTGTPVLRVAAWVVLSAIPVVFFAGPAIFWSGVSKAQEQTLARAGQAHLGAQRWQFSDEGIRKTSDLGDVKIPWVSVTRLLIGEDHVVFVNDVGFPVVTIPRRSFASSDSQGGEVEFRAMIERLSGRKFENVFY